MYERKDIYTVSEVLDKVIRLHKSHRPKDFIKVKFGEDWINMASQRYKVFKDKGVKCVCCGREGVLFIKERTPGTEKYHFNLYAIDDSGDLILMTKDHIIPRAKGGKNRLDNYQPMCQPCNVEKGAKIKEQAG